MNQYCWIFVVVLALYPAWALPLLVSLRPRPHKEDKKAIEKSVRSRMNVQVVLTAIIAMVLLILLFSRGLAWIAALNDPAWKECIFMIRVDPAYWMVAGIFLAFPFAYYLALLSLKLVYPAYYALYLTVDEAWMPLDVLKVVKVIFHVLVPVMLVFIILGLNQYTSFEKTGLRQNAYFQLKEKHLEYNEVKAVYRVSHYIAPNGAILDETHFVLVFDDDTFIRFRQSDMTEGMFISNVQPYVSAPVQETDYFPVPATL